MCTKIYQVFGWKNETESTNRRRVYLYHELIVEVAYLFDLNFVIKLYLYTMKLNNNMKRSKSSFDNFSAKHTPSATLI